MAAEGMSCGAVGWGEVGVERSSAVKRKAAVELSGKDIEEAKRALGPARSREVRAAKVDVGNAGTAAAGVVARCDSTSPTVHNQTYSYPRVKERKGNTP